MCTRSCLHSTASASSNSASRRFPRHRYSSARNPASRPRARSSPASSWTATCPDRLFCHCYARGKGNAQLIPGWPYSVIAALEPGRTSWTLPLDAVRLGPADDATAVTAAQVREVTGRIIAAGHWRDGDPDILVVLDAGYDLTRLAWLLRDLPVEVADAHVVALGEERLPRS